MINKIIFYQSLRDKGLFKGNDIPVYTKRHKALIMNENVYLKDSSQIAKYLYWYKDARGASSYLLLE